MDEKVKQDDYDRMKERYKKEIAAIQEKKDNSRKPKPF